MKHLNDQSPAPAIRKDPPRAREKSFAEEVVEELSALRWVIPKSSILRHIPLADAINAVCRIDRRRKRREGRKK